jgi:hypothetical protein
MARPQKALPRFLGGLFGAVVAHMLPPVETDRKSIPLNSGAEWGASKRAAALFLAHPLRERSLKGAHVVHHSKIIPMMTGSEHPHEAKAPYKHQSGFGSARPRRA